MENETQPKPAEVAEQSASDAIWFISKWAVGGILQLMGLVGTMFLSILTFVLLRNSAIAWWMVLCATVAVFAAGMAGVQWIKTQWIIHAMPEVLEDFAQKNG